MADVLTRRGFLKGCSTVIAAQAGARITNMTFRSAEAAAAPNEETLVLVYLRGGMDSLNTIVPTSGNDLSIYQNLRPSLKVDPGNTSDLGNLGGTQFGLNQMAADLMPLYQSGNVAFALNTGSVADSRSHFDMQHWMEVGATGSGQTLSGGWLARHLNSCVQPDGDVLVQSLAVGNAPPESLDGASGTLTITGSKPRISFEAPDPYRQLRVAMRDVFNTGTSIVHGAGSGGLNVQEVLFGLSDYGMYENADLYSALDSVAPLWSIQLQRVAEVIKAGLGLQTVTIDLGGWDTHSGQGDGNSASSYYSQLLWAFSHGLSVFWEDLAQTNSNSKVTVIAMTEFGRRVEEGGGGTDHGHGGAMIALGNTVNGGLHGDWLGLDPDVLYENIDLPVTTDYRTVISEYMMRRQKNNALGVVFPGYSGYSPMGLFQGNDLTPSYATVSACGGGTPLNVGLTETQQLENGKSKWQGVTLASAGLAATTGLLALRNRRSIEIG